jgi:cell division septation protein DedD
MINKRFMKKCFQVTHLKASNVDKEAVRRSLSWQPDGRCDIFTRAAILLFAPPTSGVYGLSNIGSQIFIGESANIQDALLRHESETDFRSRHLRPTGFTFETCAAELRKPKADELIARFHPVLQTEAALIETWSLSNGSTEGEVGLGDQNLETLADHLEFPVYGREERPKVRRRFYLTQTQAVALLEILVASAAVIFYLGIPIGKNIQKRAEVPKSPAAAINRAGPSQAGIGSRPQNVSSIDSAGGLTTQIAPGIAAKLDVDVSASIPNSEVRYAATSASATDRVGVQPNTSPMAKSTESVNLSKWSVQISAAPAKEIADSLVQRLKASGYDGYVVRAELKEKTYYRVRVGHFESREKAESVRHTLARQEGYRDAYLTAD